MSAFPPLPRDQIRSLRPSLIRQVANAGLGRSDIEAFWFGESDQPTPDFIRKAAAEALLEGRTFYTHNLGRLDLRETLSGYLTRLHGVPIDADRLGVTSAGVNALMVATQAIVSPGDRVVVVSPVWPNVAEIPRILGAEVVSAPLAPRNGRWTLDLDRLLDALTPGTRALFLNSPNNPTGWTLDPDHRAPLLEHCRRHGIWLVSDDVYERLNFLGESPAPSFLPLADPDDRLISANSFSKAWRMTGWRLGWLTAPRPLIEGLGVLLEYNTSCAPEFVQSGAIAALTEGEESVRRLRTELRSARDQVLLGLRNMPRIEAPEPDGGMYAFFRVDGVGDSLALATDLVRTAGLGLAPGAAFGPEGEGWLRWCFAARQEKNARGLQRLSDYLAAHLTN